MRSMNRPFQGYLGSIDQNFYWKFNETVSTATMVDSSVTGTSHLTPTASPAVAASLFDGDSPVTGSRRFNAAAAQFGVSATGLNHHLSCATDWSISWFQGGLTVATGAIVEYALNGAGVAISAGLGLGIYYLGVLNRLCISYESSLGTFQRIVSTASIPATGRIGVTRKHESSGSYSYRVFVDDKLVEVMVGSVAPTSTAGSAGKWIVGGSLRHGDAGGTVPALHLSGFLDEFAMWQPRFTNEQMLEIYGDCRRPFDEATLFRERSHEVRVRVLVADASGEMVDFSALSNRNWVQSVAISEDIEEPVNKAVVQFKRRFGKFADLSPLNTGSEFVGALAHRRRVVIQNAIIPALWTMQGWEWQTRFEGYVDAWEVKGDRIEVKCLDLAAPMIDQFIMEPKAYDFSAANKLAETAVQQIITDNVPVLRTAAGGTTVGYLGGTPVLYTPAGSAASVALGNSVWNLRYNDTTSAPVMENIKAVPEMIGFDLRFQYHAPWGTHRLTMYNPPREKAFSFNRAEEDTDGLVKITSDAPHGMALGQTFTVTGPTAASFGGTFVVGEIVSHYTFKAETGVSGTPTLVTAGSIGYGAHYTLQGADILSVDPVSSDLADLRNHIVVRYARDGTTASMVGNAVSDGSGIITITLPESVANIDVDSSGIDLEISGSVTAAFNGKYTGRVLGSRTVRTDQAIGASLSTTSLLFESDYVKFKEVVSTASASVAAIGLRQAGVYEGSTTNIDTVAEAQALADRILSDLSTPQADLSIKTRIMPFQLHDTLALVEDTKGRWSGTLNTAVVSLSEKYDSGECSAEYKLRGTKPSAGRNSGRVLVGGRRGVFPGNLVVPIDVPNLGMSIGIRHARGFPVRWKHPRGKGSLRYDRTEIHVSTACPGFVPSKNTYAGMTRGNSVHVTHDGAGAELSPGTTYYTKLRHRDIFDNLSQSTSASISGTVIRYMDQAPGAFATTASVVTGASTSTRTFGSATATMLFLDIDTGVDAASMSFDTSGNYSTVSMGFQAPTQGVVAISARTNWYCNSAQKPGGDLITISLRHTRNGSTLPTSSFLTNSVTVISGLTGVGLARFDGSVHVSSGDMLSVFVNGEGGICSVKLVGCSTATVQHSAVSFMMLAER